MFDLVVFVVSPLHGLSFQASIKRWRRANTSRRLHLGWARHFLLDSSTSFFEQATLARALLLRATSAVATIDTAGRALARLLSLPSTTVVAVLQRESDSVSEQIRSLAELGVEEASSVLRLLENAQPKRKQHQKPRAQKLQRQEKTHRASKMQATAAALVLQARWRGIVARRKFARIRTAVAVLQRFARHALLLIALRRVAEIAHHAKQRQKSEHYRASALAMCAFILLPFISSHARTHICRHEKERETIAGLPADAVERYHRVRSAQAATKLQAAWRGRLARSRFAVLQEQRRLDTAAARIQRAFRTHKARQRAFSAAVDAVQLAESVEPCSELPLHRLAALQAQIIARVEAAQHKHSQTRTEQLQHALHCAFHGLPLMPNVPMPTTRTPAATAEELQATAGAMYDAYVASRGRRAVEARIRDSLLARCTALADNFDLLLQKCHQAST